MTSITIGKSDAGKAVKLDIARLIVSRLLATATSGGGKSWLLRKILEEVSRTTQTIVIDTEAEFASLREKRDMVLAGPSGEVPAEPRAASLLCRRLMEMNLSAVIDVSELDVSERQTFVANFCNTIVEMPRSLWRPCFVCIDEIQEYAAEGDKNESAKAVGRLAVRGRKRGYCLLGATLRLSGVDKDVAAGLKNQFIGQMSLDLDLKRAAATLGFEKARWQEIRDLSPPDHEGEFFSFGPALNHRGVIKMRGGAVETTHPKSGQGRLAKPPEASTKIKSVLGELTDLAKKADEEAKTLADAQKQIVDLQRQLRAAPKPEADQQAIERARASGKAEAARESAAAVKERDRIIGLLKGRMGKAAAQFSAALPLLSVNGEAEPKVVPPKEVEIIRPKLPHTPALKPLPVRHTSVVSTGDLTPRQQRFLDAAATLTTLSAEVTRETVAAWVGVHPRGGSVGEELKALSDGGYIVLDRGRIAVTDAGHSAAGHVDPTEAIDRAKSGLTARQARFFESIIAAYPGEVTREQIAEQFELHPRGGSLGEDLTRLVGRGLVEGKRGRYKAREFLFVGG